jgi:RimJ/RimL family protein N-acetyltransferase
LSAALTRVAFELAQVERVEIHCAAENIASASVPRKLGYTLDGTLRRRSLLLDGQYHDSMVWSLFRHEYPASPSAKAEIQAYDGLGRRLL